MHRTGRPTPKLCSHAQGVAQNASPCLSSLPELWTLQFFRVAGKPGTGASPMLPWHYYCGCRPSVGQFPYDTPLPHVSTALRFPVEYQSRGNPMFSKLVRGTRSYKAGRKSIQPISRGRSSCRKAPGTPGLRNQADWSSGIQTIASIVVRLFRG